MIQRSCSWCHEPNVWTAGPCYCSNCGHRSDVPRLSCDCGQCRPAEADDDPEEATPLAADLGGES